MKFKIDTYHVDGHHLHFDCCNKTLAIVYDESDDVESLVSCPFCGKPIQIERDFA